MIHRFFLWVFGPDHRVYAEVTATAVALAVFALILFVAIGEIYMTALDR